MAVLTKVKPEATVDYTAIASLDDIPEVVAANREAARREALARQCEADWAALLQRAQAGNRRASLQLPGLEAQAVEARDEALTAAKKAAEVRDAVAVRVIEAHRPMLETAFRRVFDRWSAVDQEAAEILDTLNRLAAVVGSVRSDALYHLLPELFLPSGPMRESRRIDWAKQMRANGWNL